MDEGIEWRWRSGVGQGPLRVSIDRDGVHMWMTGIAVVAGRLAVLTSYGVINDPRAHAVPHLVDDPDTAVACANAELARIPYAALHAEGISPVIEDSPFTREELMERVLQWVPGTRGPGGDISDALF